MTEPIGPARVVYALNSSREPEHFRYVGQTRKGASARLSAHLKHAQAGRQMAVWAWIRVETAAGWSISTAVLQECRDDAELNLQEARWIVSLRDEGHALVNKLAGGGWVPQTIAANEKRAAKLRVTWADPEFRARQSSRLKTARNTPRGREAAARAGRASGAARRRKASDADSPTVSRLGPGCSTRTGPMAAHKGAHLQWHVRRGIVHPACPLCITDPTSSGLRPPG